MRVRLVEDNKNLAEAVKGALVKSYAVDVANNIRGEQKSLSGVLR